MAPPLSAAFNGSFPVGQNYGVTMFTGEFAGHGYPPKGQSLPLWHTGIDYSMPSGTQLYAMADGVVVHASLDEVAYSSLYNGSYGLVLRIAYDNGYYSLYAHQSSIEVTNGQRVVRGQPVSHSGGDPPKGVGTNSGNSFGAHLHFEVRNNQGGYGSDINPSSVVDFGAQAAQSAPTPPVIPGLPHSDAGGTAAGNTAAAAPAGIPVGPQLPTESMPLRTVRPSASSLTSLDPTKGQPIMACDLDGVLLPVVAANVQMTTFKASGSYKVTLPLSLVGAISGGAILDRLVRRRRTQVTLYAGYVAHVLDATAGDLTPIFTGFTEVPHFVYRGGQMHLDLSGPDMSGLLSMPSATESNLQQFANQSASDVARTLAARHNLDTSIDVATDHIGSYFDSATLKTRKKGQTEWDILTQLAINQGFVLYVDGTTLRFGRLPDPIPALVTLRYQVRGEPAGPVEDLQIDAAPHSKRDYAVVVQSYDTRSKQSAHGKAGTSQAAADAAGPFTALLGANQSNVDALQVITITEPSNTPQKALDAKAASILALYQSTEYVLTATIKGCLPLYRFSEVVIISDTVYRGFTTKTSPVPTFYVASVSYDYTTSGGMTQTITATNRPYGVQGDVSAPATGLF